MISFQSLMIGFLLAKTEEDRLVAKGVAVPDNFKTMQSLVFGTVKNPLISYLFMQNEVKMLEQNISPPAATGVPGIVLSDQVKFNTMVQKVDTLETEVEGIKAEIEMEPPLKERISRLESRIEENNQYSEDKSSSSSQRNPHGSHSKRTEKSERV